MSAGEPGSIAAASPLPRRVKLALYVFFLAVYLATASGHFSSTDQISVHLTTESLAERRSLAIKPINDTVRGVGGATYGTFGIGQSILSIPLYMVGRLVERAAPVPVVAYFSGPLLCATVNGQQACEWGGSPRIFFVSLLTQIVAPATCVVVCLFALRLGFSRGTSLLLTLAYGLATAQWVYAKEPFQHTVEALALLLAAYVLFAHRADLRPSHALQAGAALAVGVLTRLNLAIAVPLFVGYLWLLKGGWPRRVAAPPAGSDGPARPDSALRVALHFLAPIGLALCVVAAVNVLKFGDPLAYNPNAGRLGWSNPVEGLYANLFSLGRSIFVYSPPLLLALLGQRAFFARHRFTAGLFLALAAAYLLLYSGYGDWEGGWAWGPRFLVPLVPLLLLPLGYWLTPAHPARLVALAVVGLTGVAVQWLGMLIPYTWVYHEWDAMGLLAGRTYLFIPDLSPIPAHLNVLRRGYQVDLWLVWVYRTFGPPVAALTLASLVAVMGVAASALWSWVRPADERPLDAPNAPDRAPSVRPIAAGSSGP